MQVALSALDKAARWRSLRQHREQAPGADILALREVARDVRCELQKANSTIAHDAVLIARLHSTVSRLEAGLSNPGSAAGSVGWRHDRSAAPNLKMLQDDMSSQIHDSLVDAGKPFVQLAWARRQLCAVTYRREQKLARRALLWLLATISYAWGDDGVLQDVMAMQELHASSGERASSAKGDTRC